MARPVYMVIYKSLTRSEPLPGIRISAMVKENLYLFTVGIRKLLIQLITDFFCHKTFLHIEDLCNLCQIYTYKQNRLRKSLLIPSLLAILTHYWDQKNS